MLFAERGGTNRVLEPVVVDINRLIAHEALKNQPLFEAVSIRFAQGALGQVAGTQPGQCEAQPTQGGCAVRGAHGRAQVGHRGDHVRGKPLGTVVCDRGLGLG